MLNSRRKPRHVQPLNRKLAADLKTEWESLPEEYRLDILREEIPQETLDGIVFHLFLDGSLQEIHPKSWKWMNSIYETCGDEEWAESTKECTVWNNVYGWVGEHYSEDYYNYFDKYVFDADFPLKNQQEAVREYLEPKK